MDDSVESGSLIAQAVTTRQLCSRIQSTQVELQYWRQYDEKTFAAVTDILLHADYVLLKIASPGT